MSFGGGKTQTVTSTTEIPAYITNQHQGNIGLANTIADRPYQSYTDPRIAGLTTDQQTGFNLLRGASGTWKPLLESASTAASAAATTAPSTIQSSRPTTQSVTIGGRWEDLSMADRQRIAQNAFGYTGELGQGGLTRHLEATGQTDRRNAMQNASQWTFNESPVPQVTAASVNAAAPTQAASMDAAQQDVYARTDAATMNAASMAPVTRMDAAAIDRNNIRNVAAQTFTDADLSSYLNPYTTSVIDTTLSELSRQNTQLQNSTRARAAAAGAFGGSRAALMETENNRNYLDTAARTAAGLNQANFTQAQSAIATDQNRALQAAGMNQTMDFNVREANAGFQQAANAANMAAENSRLAQNAQFQQAANAANAGFRQAANTADGAAANAMMSQNAQFEQAANAANAGFRQAANTANAAAENNRLFQNAQFRQAAGTANASAAQQMSQFDATQRMQAALANQQAGMQGASLNLDGARVLAGLGSQQQQLATADASAMLGIGGMQQQQNQAGLDLAYQDFLRQQQYPIDMLNLRQGVLTGVPTGSSTSTPYFTNTGANMLGGALGGAQLAGSLGLGSGWGAGLAGLGAMAGLLR